MRIEHTKTKQPKLPYRNIPTGTLFTINSQEDIFLKLRNDPNERSVNLTNDCLALIPELSDCYIVKSVKLVIEND